MRLLFLFYIYSIFWNSLYLAIHRYFSHRKSGDHVHDKESTRILGKNNALFETWKKNANRTKHMEEHCRYAEFTYQLFFYNLISKTWQVVDKNNTMTIICKAWNSPAVDPSWYKWACSINYSIAIDCIKWLSSDRNISADEQVQNKNYIVS